MNVGSDFECLRVVAQKYGVFYSVQEFESFVNNIRDEQLTELSIACDAIDSKNHSFRLSRWIDECLENRKKTPKREFDFSCQVGQLLCLFGYLARKGIQPFSNENVKYEEIAKKPNWKNLPSEFHYLIDAAEAFAAQSTEADAIDFLENVHPKDSEALARVAETVRLNGHAKKINEWFKKFPLHMHPEASLVFSLLMLMDHAGLKFE